MTAMRLLLMPWLLLAALATALMSPAAPAQAHEIRPALLEVVERQPGWLDVTFKVPVRNGSPLALFPVFPEGFEAVATPNVSEIPGARIERVSYRSDNVALVGGTITIEGLERQQVDTIIQIILADGAQHSAIVRPKDPSYEVPRKASSWEVMESYWILGVEHILGGVDHLLFVLALTLLIPGKWMLVKAITAFTVAHSVTLALATLGFVHVPPAPTEAVIALSIVFLAAELVHGYRGMPGITARAPWIVAFAFGLFHGLGFAGALTDIGLPEHAIPLALLFFNIGVEAGQLLFIAVVLLFIWASGRVNITLPRPMIAAPAYGIGAVAMYWTIERVAGMA